MSCPKGNHNLVEILQSYHSWDGSRKVARWCEICGAIVVDIDYDGRINPGGYMKLIGPNHGYHGFKKIKNS